MSSEPGDHPPLHRLLHYKVFQHAVVLAYLQRLVDKINDKNKYNFVTKFLLSTFGVDSDTNWHKNHRKEIQACILANTLSCTPKNMKLVAEEIFAEYPVCRSRSIGASSSFSYSHSSSCSSSSPSYLSNSPATDHRVDTISDSVRSLHVKIHTLKSRPSSSASDDYDYDVDVNSAFSVLTDRATNNARTHKTKTNKYAYSDDENEEHDLIDENTHNLMTRATQDDDDSDDFSHNNDNINKTNNNNNNIINSNNLFTVHANLHKEIGDKEADNNKKLQVAGENDPSMEQDEDASSSSSSSSSPSSSSSSASSSSYDLETRANWTSTSQILSPSRLHSEPTDSPMKRELTRGEKSLGVARGRGKQRGRGSKCLG